MISSAIAFPRPWSHLAADFDFGPITSFAGRLPRFKALQRLRHRAFEESIQPPHPFEPLAPLRGFAGEDPQALVRVPPQPAHGVETSLHEPVPSIAADAVVIAPFAGQDCPFDEADMFEEP